MQENPIKYSEIGHVLQGVLHDRCVDGALTRVLLDPGVADRLLRVITLVGVVFEHALDELFRLARNLLPFVEVKRIGTFGHTLHDLLVVLAVERWEATQKDV